MKVVLSLLLLAASAANAQNLRASASSSRKCYTNTTEIYEALKDDSLVVNEPKRFVVCPNTTMDLGYLVPGVGITNGQSPLIPRPNTEFLCGEDGRSSNNCVLRGGDFGVILVPVFFRQDIKVENVKISGFTFHNQNQYGVFAASEGSLKIHDCIFEDSTNYGPMVFQYDPTVILSPKNETKEDKEEEEQDDDTDAYSAKILDVTIQDCVFKNLSSTEMKLGVEPGIITIKGPNHNIHMENNLFVNNHYANETNTAVGYAVLSQNATMNIQNNCFINNEFRGNGPILLDHHRDSPYKPRLHTQIGDNNYATTTVQQQGDAISDCDLGALIETTPKESFYGRNHSHKLWIWDSSKKQDDYVCLPVMVNECSIPGYQMHLAAASGTEEEMGQAIE